MFRTQSRRLFLYLIILGKRVEEQGLRQCTELTNKQLQHNNDGSTSQTLIRCDSRSFHETGDESEIVSVGNALLKEKKFDQASLCYTEAIKKNDSEASYYRRRGYCRSKVSKLDEALPDFQKAVQLDPNNELGQTFLSETLFESEKFDELIERIHTSNYGLTLLAALADQLYEGKKFEHALRFYTELIIKYPENSAHRHRRGHCYWETGDIEETIFDFRKSVRLDPFNVEYSLDLGEALVESGKCHEAEDVLDNVDVHNLRKSDFARLEKVRQKINDVKEAGEKTLTERLIVTARQSGNNIRKRRMEKLEDKWKSKGNL